MRNNRRRIVLMLIAVLSLIIIDSCKNTSNNNQSSAELAEVQIKDSTLKHLLSDYLLNKHINKKEGIFQLFVISNNVKCTKYYITYAWFASDLMRFAPSGYFYLEGEWVLYYTGFDQYFIDRRISIDASKYKGKCLYWDIDFPSRKSEIDRKTWVFMKTKLTKLFVHVSDSNKWVEDVGNDDILFGTIPKKCETEYFRNP